MAQGLRGRLLQVAATGFGVVLCTGLIGCQNTDKAKDTKAVTKQPPPGLPGTPSLTNGTATTRPVTPNAPYGTVGASGTSNTYNPNVQPAGGAQTSPALGMGNGTSSTQFGSANNGMNTLTSVPQNPGYQSPPRSAAPIGAPVQPYSSATGGPVGAATPTTPNPGSALSSTAFSPAPPQLEMQILPPPPPSYPTAGGATASAPVSSPSMPLAPVAPPKPTGNVSMSGFGGQ